MIARILLLALGAWLAWATLAFLLQRRFLYPGAYVEPADGSLGAMPAGVEEIWLEHDGGRSEAWLIPAAPSLRSGPGPDGPADASATGAKTTPASADRPAPAPALLFFHGNGELIDDVVDALLPFAGELGVTLLVVEYPGFGRSPGAPSKENIEAAAAAAWDHLAARPDVDAHRMVAMGRSLGGGPAAGLARVRAPAALILQSTFTDVGTMAARHSLVPPFLIRDRWRPVEGVRAFDGPVLVLHGREDRIVPFRHGEALAAARNGVRFHPLPCGHNDCPPPGAAWWETVRGFLEEAGVLPPDGSGPPSPNEALND